MGYLDSTGLWTLPSHSKAIVRWVGIVPAAAIAAAEADAGTGRFAKLIPLVQWGAKQSGDGDDLGPCYIAVNCGSPGEPTIEVQIQMQKAPEIDNADTLDEFPATVKFYCNAPITPGAVLHIITSYDMSDGVAAENTVAYPGLPDPDHLSDYVTNSISAWLAVNDVNFPMSSAGTSAGSWPTGGPAYKIVPFEAFSVAETPHTVDETTATYSLTSPTVGAGPVGVPVAGDYSASNAKLKWGEVTIAIGVAMDLSVTGNRRTLLKSDGKPETDFTAFDALIGKTPEVRLHKSDLIKVGVNSGTLGNFTKTGTVTIVADSDLDITP